VPSKYETDHAAESARFTAAAREKAANCPKCGEPTGHCFATQIEKAGSMVEWFITCPGCEHRFHVDMRPKAFASDSPFHRPPERRRRQ
jgi:DNA-directed RNA polymerase subunit M/transcription elongation factor TFIIS